MVYHTRRTHTREALDHHPAVRSTVSSATVSNLCPDMPSTSMSGRPTVRPCRSKVSQIPEERHASKIDATRWSGGHDDAAIFKWTSTWATLSLIVSSIVSRLRSPWPCLALMTPVYGCTECTDGWLADCRQPKAASGARACTDAPTIARTRIANSRIDMLAEVLTT